MSSRRGERFEQPGVVCTDVAQWLVAWQDTADEAWLERVIAATVPRLERIARHVLRRHHVHDWAAVDDVLSLALDHLRRLPVTTMDERTVARFDAAVRPRRGDGDPGLSYLTWLVRERSIDVVRRRRRQAAREMRFVEDGAGRPCHEAFDEDRAAQLHEAVRRLEPRLRAVVELLLAGRSQAAIAHMLGVCEGTVSRLRTRAIADLRGMME